MGLHPPCLRDLLADSIKLVELMLRLEEMGVDIPVEAAWERLPALYGARCRLDC